MTLADGGLNTRILRGQHHSTGEQGSRQDGGSSVTENCVPACLSCNGRKSDADVFDWYRRQRFYDPRRAMAIRAWMDGDLRLAVRLLQWAQPDQPINEADDISIAAQAA